MSNITLSVDDDVIKKVRKIAVDRNTTLTELVRDFLTRLSDEDAIRKELALDELETSFRRHSRRIGRKTWTRDSLHER